MNTWINNNNILNKFSGQHKIWGNATLVKLLSFFRNVVSIWMGVKMFLDWEE